MSLLHLSFFGIAVDVTVDSPADERYLRFFFHRFLDRREPAEIHVTLLSENPEGFFASLLAKDRATKTMKVVEANADETVIFTDWSGVPSPLPPFGRRRFSERLCVLPGAALVTPAGDCVLLLGGTHAGKTAIELELLLTGWRTMADHLIVCDLESGRILPYLTPIGIRGEGLRRWSDALKQAETRETVSEVTGKVVLVDVESLVPGSSWSTPLPPKGVVVFSNENMRTDDFVARRVFPERHRKAMMHLIPDRMVSAESVDSIRALWEMPIRSPGRNIDATTDGC